jgi:hypothetical protein
MVAYQDQLQNPFQTPFQSTWMNPQLAQTYGPGQAAYGQQFGQYGGQQFGQPNMSGWGMPGWGPQRQLSHNEVGDVVRQIVPLLPQLLAQAQQHPQAAFGYGGWGQQNYGQFPRMLTQQDVNEVVRQILPILPQIVGMLQGQGPLQAGAMYGGWSGHIGPNAQFANPYQQSQFGYQGWPHMLSAFGGTQAGGQRQLTQQDVNDVVRQLVGIIPQVIGNLQAYGQRVN